MTIQLVHEDHHTYLPAISTRSVDAGGETCLDVCGDVSEDPALVDTLSERLDLATRVETSPDVLLLLADDGDCHVRSTITFNPNVPMLALIHLLHDPDAHVRQCACSAFRNRGGIPEAVEA